MNIKKIIQSYDLNNITIGVLGGHSALDVCLGAKKHGFKTVCVAKKGREKTYAKYYKTREINNTKKGCIDKIILVDEFSDIVKSEIQAQLQKLNTIFIHNRYFWVYFNFQDIENHFQIPIYGSRSLLKLEERDIANNQYYLLEKAGIRIPEIFKIPNLSYQNKILTLKNIPKKITKLTITKVNNAIRTYERENFIASNWEEWQQIAQEKLNQQKITLEALKKAVIEEFVLGAQINFNFFHSIIDNEIELMGTDTRRQTNIDGFLRLPAKEQLKIPAYFHPYHIETGHIAITCKESLLEKAFLAAKNFVQTCTKEAEPLIGPFALQGAIETDGKKEELVVFDVSLRIPGSPGIAATPYTNYLYQENISIGERIAVEIKAAQEKGEIERILT